MHNDELKSETKKKYENMSTVIQIQSTIPLLITAKKYLKLYSTNRQGCFEPKTFYRMKISSVIRFLWS